MIVRRGLEGVTIEPVDCQLKADRGPASRQRINTGPHDRPRLVVEPMKLLRKRAHNFTITKT